MPRRPIKKLTEGLQKVKPRKGEKLINETEITKILEDESIRSLEIFYLRKFGDEIEGTIYPSCDSDHLRQKLYPIEQTPGDSDSIVLIPGNKHLAKLIKEHNLIGKYVRIVYIADKPIYAGHKMKLFAIYKQNKKRS